ncbi:6380_t:CDS:2 [Funneliformis mosseae]|uniref:6380_t:CDS:1 n=1 Tax=Funneliformis mosseae TaxID=27381 RepID=A0A9N9E994_FUNMO|nr:6380_t:CDS:2 [Funneliformis mosseae]
MSEPTTSTGATLAETEQEIDVYFTINNEWSLLDYLLYRQNSIDFQPDRKKEHARYTRNLSNILNSKQAKKTMIKKAGNVLVSFQFFGWGPTCVQSPTLPDYDREVMIYGSWWFRPDSILESSQKRKFTEAAERTAVVEKHITNVVSSTFEREQTILEEITKQEMIVRNKFVNCLENTDLGLDVSHKRQCLQVDNEYEHDSGSSDGPYVNSDSCYEVQDSRYTSPTPHSHDDPFTEDTEDENEKFRTYIDEAILHANSKGLYVESHTHEILSLSSILVLIPNYYSTKMVEVFGLKILESIYHEYAPTLSITLDTEIENIYRNAIKTCLRDSRGSAIDFLCKNIANRSELRDNFGILMIDLIRSLPFDKIRNEPSE